MTLIFSLIILLWSWLAAISWPFHFIFCACKIEIHECVVHFLFKGFNGLCVLLRVFLARLKFQLVLAQFLLDFLLLLSDILELFLCLFILLDSLFDLLGWFLCDLLDCFLFVVFLSLICSFLRLLAAFFSLYLLSLLSLLLIFGILTKKFY